MEAKYPKTAVYILSVMARTGYYDLREDFARIIGVHSNTLGVWLLGKALPSADSIVKLKRAFPTIVDVAYLLKLRMEDKKNAQ